MSRSGVTVNYKSSAIHNTLSNGAFKLKTKGTYMEDDLDVTVDLVPDLSSKTISQNGSYYAADEYLDGFNEVFVNVVPPLASKTITQNGTYAASGDNLDGFSSVTVNVSGGGGNVSFSRATSTVDSSIMTVEVSASEVA